MTIVDMSRHLPADCEWPFTTIGKSDAETMLTRLECRLVVSGYAQSLRKAAPQQRRSGTVSAGFEPPLTISEGRVPQHGSIWDGHRLVVNRHSQPMGEERWPDRFQRIALAGTHNRWGKRGHCNSADGVCDKMIVNKHSQPTGRIVIVSHRSGGWSSMWLSASESPLTISDKHKGVTQLRSCPERNRRNGNKIGTRPRNGSTHDARCRPVKEIPQEPESRAV